MADILRREPVPSAPAAHQGVTIVLAPPVRRWSLRAKSRQALETHLELQLPRKIGEVMGELICLGPDEWLWRGENAAPKASAAGLPLSIVDVSERSIGLVVEGERALDVLASGCPRDLSRLGVGQGARTVYEGVEIILLRTGEARFEVEVWRSFAPWLWTALTTVAGHPA